MASLYERRRARLGMDEDPMGGVGMPTPEDENAAVGAALTSKLSQPGRGAAGGVTGGVTPPVVAAPRPGVSKPKPVGTPIRGGEREDVDAGGITMNGEPDIPEDDTGIPTDDETAATGTEGWADFSPPRVTGDIGRVAGVDPANWGNMESTKYRALEFIAAGEPITINNTARKVASPEFQAMFPGATFDGKDKIDFHGMVDPHSGAILHEIDVLQSADPANPDQELVGYWNDLTNDGGGGAAGGGEGGGITASMEGLTDSDALAEIMAQINSLAEGGNAAESDALRRMLEGGV